MQFTQINQDIPLLYRPRFLESESFSYESRTGSNKYWPTPPPDACTKISVFIYMADGSKLVGNNWYFGQF